MESIVIEASRYCPRVEFDINGKLKMEGRSIPEDVSKLFSPLIQFVCELTAETVVFDINLEYFNTASSKKILELLKHLEANSQVGKVKINWFFEDGDEDSVEIAEIYEESLMRSEFRYVLLQEAAA